MPTGRVALGKEQFQMLHWFNDSGYQAEFRACVAAIPSCRSGRLRTGCARRLGGQAQMTVRRDKLGCPLTQT
jgi:hypothetical protein